MKKLSDFQENKVELKNVKGGITFSSRFIKAHPGPLSDPGNYIASASHDVNGVWSHLEMAPLDSSITPRYLG